LGADCEATKKIVGATFTEGPTLLLHLDIHQIFLVAIVVKEYDDHSYSNSVFFSGRICTKIGRFPYYETSE
jgi:hypothetical protein